MQKTGTSTREIKEGINSCLEKVNEYLEKIAIPVTGKILKHVSTISCNNDKYLGDIISEAYEKVGKDGVVLMEESETRDTHVELTEGVQFDCGLTSPHFITNKDKQLSELDNPLILICASEIPNVRKIQKVLEHVIKKGRSLLIIAPVAQQVKSALLMNKVKGNIKVNIIALPGFGSTKKDTCEDLAILTGAKVIDEELGDDLDLIDIDVLGEAEYSVTDDKYTVVTTTDNVNEDIQERIKYVSKLISDEKNGFIKEKLEQRLSMLSGSVGIIKVGADSKIELKEKKDRVEDAIYATKAALKEGIVPGGGVALLNAAQKITSNNIGETILLRAIKAPYETILQNAGIKNYTPIHEGNGIDVVTGRDVDMVYTGIVDPVLVTKSALKNAVSVASTIMSADCVISNIRVNESSK